MVEIRPATLKDLEHLLSCEIQIWESLREYLPESFVNPNIEMLRRPETFDNFKRFMENKEVIFLIALKDDEIIGLASGRVGEGGVGHLGFLGVRPEHRRKGVGSSLLQKYLKEAKKRNAHKVWLFTAPSLHSAINLYVKTGFVPEGYMRRHLFGLDLIFYSKFLS